MKTSSKTFSILSISIWLLLPHLAQAETLQGNAGAVLTADHREEPNIKRDVYRHPLQTLDFLGLKAGMTVLEIWPGKGWYTEILAPLTRDNNILYVAGFAMTAERSPAWRKNLQTDFANKLAARPDVYDHVVVTELSVPERTTIAPPGTVDLLLTFRNVHNWMKGDYAEGMLQVFRRAIKSGGILGIVEHRARPGTSIDEMIKTGYVTEAHVIKLAEDAGFELQAKSEINANPLDSTNHPAGVWSLPPTLRVCKKIEQAEEAQACEQKYRAIGESDRMTLRFRKK